MSQTPHRPPDDRYRPLNWRRRLLLIGLAVATAGVGVTTLLTRPGGVHRPPPGQGPDRARCSAGQTQDCVGGTSAVIVPGGGASAPGR